MFDMRQHVDVPTHRHGGTLDLVMTFADYELQQVSVDPGCILSDHKVVTCQIPVTVGQEEVAERIVRGWRRVDRGVLRRTLQDSPLCHPVPENVTVDELLRSTTAFCVTLLIASYHNTASAVVQGV